MRPDFPMHRSGFQWPPPTISPYNVASQIGGTLVININAWYPEKDSLNGMVATLRFS